MLCVGNNKNNKKLNYLLYGNDSGWFLAGNKYLWFNTVVLNAFK